MGTCLGRLPAALGCAFGADGGCTLAARIHGRAGPRAPRDLVADVSRRLCSPGALSDAASTPGRRRVGQGRLRPPANDGVQMVRCGVQSGECVHRGADGRIDPGRRCRGRPPLEFGGDRTQVVFGQPGPRGRPGGDSPVFGHVSGQLPVIRPAAFLRARRVSTAAGESWRGRRPPGPGRMRHPLAGPRWSGRRRVAMRIMRHPVEWSIPPRGSSARFAIAYLP